MARYTGPVCRLCRAEATKLFLKGMRCMSAKCAFERRPTPPGMHGRARQKQSNYGAQLREKQKLRRIYGVLERQFRICFARANRRKGVTGDALLQLLETRLDNVVYRAGLATSRVLARQLVNHALITVNGRKASIPSHQLRAGDIVGVRQVDRARAKVKIEFSLNEAYVPPEWLQVDKEKLTATVTRLPERQDIVLPVNESLVVELYSK